MLKATSKLLQYLKICTQSNKFKLFTANESETFASIHTQCMISGRPTRLIKNIERKTKDLS